MTIETNPTLLVLGAGPAGLTAGYLLGQAGRDVLVLEAEDQVGGLAKTVEIDGYRFDLGGHRFFTKSLEVDTLWHEILGDEFLLRPRMSRIYWSGRYLDYPLRGADVVRKLGPVELARCMASYVRAATRTNKVDETFEDWVTNRFGKRLFELFFKSYTEKLWGVPTTEIRAEWAAQRIKGLSFFSAAKAAFFGNKGNKVKSLISEFHYPRFGPGQMWDAMTAAIEEQGGEVRTGAQVDRIELAGGRVVEVEAGGESFAAARRRRLEPAAARDRADGASAAAAGGRRRGARSALPRFPDGRAGRRRRGSLPGQLDLHPRAGRARRPDPELPLVVALDGSRPRQGLCRARVLLLRRGRPLDDVRRRSRRARRRGRARDGSVWRRSRRSSAASRSGSRRPIRSTTATTPSGCSIIRGWLDGIENFQQVGRNGLHRYNNSDHSMLTAMRAVDNLLAGAHHDIWEVNAESVYHESDVVDEQPYRVAPEPPELQALREGRAPVS